MFLEKLLILLQIKNINKFVLFFVFCLYSCSNFDFVYNNNGTNSELSVAELKQIVRMIVEESIEQCTVSGTMEGRAKLNLAVEGEVVARMTCEFKS